MPSSEKFDSFNMKEEISSPEAEFSYSTYEDQISKNLIENCQNGKN